MSISNTYTYVYIIQVPLVDIDPSLYLSIYLCVYIYNSAAGEYGLNYMYVCLYVYIYV